MRPVGMKIWQGHFEYARLAEGFGIAMTVGGIITAWSSIDKLITGVAIMAVGLIFLFVSAYHGRKGDIEREKFDATVLKGKR